MSNIQNMGGNVPRVGNTESGSTSAARQAAIRAAMGDGTGRSPSLQETASPAQAVQPGSGGQKPRQDRAAVEEVARQMNESMSNSTSLRFQVDGDSHKVVVRVVDKTTEELIRQIPSKEILEMSKRIREMQGALLDKRA